MKDFFPPFRQWFKKPLSLNEMDELWHGIERERKRRRSSKFLLKRYFFRSLSLGSAMAMAAWLLFYSGSFFSNPLKPLAMQNGTELVAKQVLDVQDKEAKVNLSDGTVLNLNSNTKLSVLSNKQNRVEWSLEKGNANFTIPPNLGRSWLIHSGSTQVEVLGTEFMIEHSFFNSDKIAGSCGEQHTKVLVVRGKVRVSGDFVPGHEIILGPSDHVDVMEPMTDCSKWTQRTDVEENIPKQESLPSATVSMVHSSPTPATSVTEKEWKTLLDDGKPKEAYEAVTQAGGMVAVQAKSKSVDELWVLADVARLSGHAQQAIRPLEEIAASSSPRSALAFYTIGQIQLNALGASSKAVVNFEKSLNMGLPGALQEDALAYLVKAYANSSNTSKAQENSLRYSKQFPNGKHFSEIKKWLPSDTETSSVYQKSP